MAAETVNIEANVRSVLERVKAAAVASGRKPDAVGVLAATKTRTPAEIQRAIRAGITLCGENRAQELLEKLPRNAYAGAELHFIGAFQSNKAHLLAGKTAMVESLGTEKAAAILGRLGVLGGFVTDVLLEVNIGGEAAKSGFAPERIPAVCASLFAMAGLRLRGLMVIPPAGEDATGYFARTKALFDGVRRDAPECFDTLSMGMSRDFETAIREGSTLVRVGTGIFGPRDYGAPQ